MDSPWGVVLPSSDRPLLQGTTHAGKRINSASDLYRILDKSSVGDQVGYRLQA